MKTSTFRGLSYRLTTLLCVLLWSFVPKAAAQAPADELDTFLKTKMQERRIPGLQLAVVRQGKVVKLGQYGLANLQDSVPVTRQSRFFLNSITKAFVGVAVMQLVEAGKLDLAAPASRYLTGLPAAWHPVTVRQLLTHTSGLPDIMPEDEMVTEGNFGAAWARVQTQPLAFAPGAQFAYNQTNYLLLGQLINHLSGQPFARFIQERQLNVVGMPRTTSGDAHDVLPNAARGYTYAHYVDGQRRRSSQPRNLFEVFPPKLRTAAGMSSSAEDVAHWLVALQQGKLLQSNSLVELRTPGVLTNGTQRGFSKLLNGYALGWPTINRPEHPAMAAVGGGRSAVFLYPQDDMAIVVLTNLQGANPESFVDEIAGFYLPDMRAAAGFGLPSSIRTLQTDLRQRGYDKAIDAAKQAKKKNPSFHLAEDDVNAWGYTLMQQKQLKEALQVFKLNVSLYPYSANTYDSLAELYAELGDTALARKNYQRALALNPKNTTAAQYLQTTGAKAKN